MDPGLRRRRPAAAGRAVAELTGLLGDQLLRAGWTTGLRVIARRERPHPGAQLRLTDADGWRITLAERFEYDVKNCDKPYKFVVIVEFANSTDGSPKGVITAYQSFF